MGWDVGIRGELEVEEGFDLQAWGAQAASVQCAPKHWPFEGASGTGEPVEQILSRLANLAAPEFFESPVRKGRLTIRAWWSSTTFLEHAEDLLAILDAAALLGARGIVNVVGFGDDHGFEIVLRAGRALVRLMGERAVALLQPELALDLTAQAASGKERRAKPSNPKPKPRSTTAGPASALPLDQARSLVGPSPYQPLSSAHRRKLGVFRMVGEQQSDEAIPWLEELLDHPTLEVRHAAADALLYYRTAAALEPLIARLSDAGAGGHGISAVSALFKLRPTEAFDTLEPVRTRVAEHPRRMDLVATNVLDYLLLCATDDSDSCAYDYDRHGLPRDIVQRDPRWLDWALEIAAVTAQGLAFGPLRLLVRARDPRAWEGFVRAARVHDISLIVQHLEFIGDPAAVPALRAARADPTHPYGAVLDSVASRLSKRKKPAGVPY